MSTSTVSQILPQETSKLIETREFEGPSADLYAAQLEHSANKVQDLVNSYNDLMTSYNDLATRHSLQDDVLQAVADQGQKEREEVCKLKREKGSVVKESRKKHQLLSKLKEELCELKIQITALTNKTVESRAIQTSPLPSANAEIQTNSHSFTAETASQTAHPVSAEAHIQASPVLNTVETQASSPESTTNETQTTLTIQPNSPSIDPSLSENLQTQLKTKNQEIENLRTQLEELQGSQKKEITPLRNKITFVSILALNATAAALSYYFAHGGSLSQLSSSVLQFTGVMPHDPPLQGACTRFDRVNPWNEC